MPSAAVCKRAFLMSQATNRTAIEPVESHLKALPALCLFGVGSQRLPPGNHTKYFHRFTTTDKGQGRGQIPCPLFTTELLKKWL